MKSEIEDFIPFGREWEKEVSKLPKKFIIDQWRNLAMERNNYTAEDKQKVFDDLKQLEK